MVMMSGKRQATSDLNHDNWDRVEEPEERGTFRTATAEELKNREIKKAKRKLATSAGNDTVDGNSDTKSVFSGFSGFGKRTSSAPFSFLSKIPAVAAATSGFVSSSTATSATPTLSFGSGSTSATLPAKSTDNTKTISLPSAVKPFDTAGETSGVSEYHKKLSCLNQAVCDWIKTHVDKNPVCILSPIFSDYEKYLEEIKNENKNVEAKEVITANTDEKSSSAGSMESFKFSDSSSNHAESTKNIVPSQTLETVTKTGIFQFGLKKPDDALVKPSTTQGFSFALKPSATEPTISSTAASSFSFGNGSNNSQSTTSAKQFSFNGASTPFSFGNIKPPDISGTTTSGDDPNEEDDDEPPKNEFKQVVEDDAVYSKKCKVFVKKDGNFVDKGVGTLYLKPIENSDKTQLLVRADTNLGNILVNVILNSAIPAQRMGKNNVMMICLPTPDVAKPTSVLLRVKTGDEADELLENIDKHKK